MKLICLSNAVYYRQIKSGNIDIDKKSNSYTYIIWTSSRTRSTLWAISCFWEMHLILSIERHMKYWKTLRTTSLHPTLDGMVECMSKTLILGSICWKPSQSISAIGLLYPFFLLYMYRCHCTGNYLLTSEPCQCHLQFSSKDVGGED